MLDIRQLMLDSAPDFEIMMTHIANLYAELFGPDAVPSASSAAELRRQYLERQPCHWAFIGTDAAGEVVAFATLAESFAVFAHGTYGIINELWVHPSQRSLGAGHRMIAELAKFGRGRGWLRIDVSAPIDPRWDRSFAFYRTCGFQSTGRKLKLMLEVG